MWVKAASADAAVSHETLKGLQTQPQLNHAHLGRLGSAFTKGPSKQDKP